MYHGYDFYKKSILHDRIFLPHNTLQNILRKCHNEDQKKQIPHNTLQNILGKCHNEDPKKNKLYSIFLIDFLKVKILILIV